MAEPATRVGRHRARRLRLRGHVQGVGFRPFVYRIAIRHGINGYVQNQLGEVEILAVGTNEALAGFEDALIDEAPPLARPLLAEAEEIDLPDTDEFRIIGSAVDASAQVFVITSCAMTAGANSKIPATDATATRSSIAHSAGRATP